MSDQDADATPGAIDLAQDSICMAIETALVISVTRALDPSAFPGSGPEHTLDILAGRIIAGLLDSGWTPPDDRPLTGTRWPAEGVFEIGRDRPLKFAVLDAFRIAQRLAGGAPDA